MSGFCKYYKQKRQVSYDNGVTWQDVIPMEYRRGSLYESNSVDCGYGDVTRWVIITGDYICDGTSKYQKMKKQISYDGGSTWKYASPAEYQKGTLIEADSTDCAFDGKLRLTYTGGTGTTYSAACDSNTILTSGETRPSGYDYSAMTTAVIGNCCNAIGGEAFRNCSGLTSVTISDSVTRIVGRAFEGCSGLTSVTIPSGVTSIGIWAFNGCSGLTTVTIGSGVTSINAGAFMDCSSLTNITIPDSVTNIGGWAFSNCTGLTSITCLATTPPSLEYEALEGVSSQIYVPAASVDAYKSASGWSSYSYRIQAIP